MRIYALLVAAVAVNMLPNAADADIRSIIKSGVKKVKSAAKTVMRNKKAFAVASAAAAGVALAKGHYKTALALGGAAGALALAKGGSSSGKNWADFSINGGD